MDPLFFLKGLVIGFAMAVPIGPIGVLCIRKTLTEGHAHALIIGFAAATADALYASIAAFGLTFVSDVIASQHIWLGVGGGGLLLFIGIRTFRARHKEPITPFENKGLLGSYASALLLALTNPFIIFALVAVFAAFGLGHRLTISSASLLVAGLFGGSLLWFQTLGYVSTLFRRRLDSGGLRWVNRVSGVLIILSGVAVVVRVI